MQFQFVLTLLVIGVLGTGVMTFFANNTPENSQATMYLSIAASNRDSKEYTEGFLEGLPTRIGHYKWLIIDTQTTSGIKNVYSSPPQERAIDEVIDSLIEGAVADDALIQSLDRVLLLAKQQGKGIRAVLVTRGTQNPATLRAIKERAEALRSFQDVTLFLAGVSEENRVRFAEAFSPIAKQVWFAGCGDTERVQLWNQL